MTTSPYHEDLRIRVIKYLAQGNGYKEASKVFELSISAIGRWNRCYKKVGHCKAKINPGAKRKIDLVQLEAYIQSNSDITLKKVAIKFNLSMWTIAFWLKKLGFSYKKKLSPTWRQRKNSEINTKIL